MASHEIEADFNFDDCQQNFDSLDQSSQHRRKFMEISSVLHPKSQYYS